MPKTNAPYLITFLRDCPEGRTRSKTKVLSEMLYWLVFAALEIVAKCGGLEKQTLFLMIPWVGWVFSSGLAWPRLDGPG